MVDGYEAVLCDLFGTLVDDRGRALDGARELTAGLPPRRWAIVTSCGARLAAALIASAGIDPPAVLVSADDVDAQKPDPAGYLRAARELGAPPDRCVVIEDSTHGVQAARRAGMDVIVVGPGKPLSRLRVTVEEDGTIVLR